MSKTSKIRRLAIYTALIAQAALGYPSYSPAISTKEEKIGEATEPLGELGEAIKGLYFLNRHYEQGHQVQNLQAQPDEIGCIVQNKVTYETKDFSGDKAWESRAKSRSVFAMQMKTNLAKITAESYQNLPQELKEIVDRSRIYSAIHFEI
jgi:hypothetical protein